MYLRFRYFILLALLLLPIVSASTPSYNVINNIETDLELGENDAGNLIFVSSQYIPDVYNLNVYNPITVQRYDVLRWLNNESATIRPPSGPSVVLAPNTDYALTQLGNYNLSKLTNASISTIVTVQQEDFNTINIQKIQQPNGIDVVFSTQSFVLTTERTVTIDAEVDDDVIAGNYDFIYKINNDTRTHRFVVKEKHDWVLQNSTLNSTYRVAVGESKYLGFYNLKNTGNVNVEIQTRKTGNSTFLISTPQPFTLYKKTESRIDLQVQVPITQKPGTYNIKLNITSEKKSVLKNFTLEIVDGVRPIIESINFSTDRAFKENEIVVVATDNNEVANVTLNYDGKDVVFDKDKQIFKKKITFDKLSRYVLTFCAVDYDDNEKCTIINKTFAKGDSIQNYDNSIVMPSKKVGKYSEFILFNLTENIPEGIKVELIEFVPLGANVAEGSYSIRVIDGDNSIKTINQLSKEVEISKSGIIKLEVRSEEVADFTGILRFKAPSYINEVSDLNFKVSFKDYDIPEDFTKSWIGGRNIECAVEDTGDLSTSYYNCELTFPIDTRPEEISVPTTIKERDQFKNEADIVRGDLDDKKRQFGVYITIFSVIIIILGLAFYFYVFQYPYIRFSTGHKLKTRYGGNEK